MKGNLLALVTVFVFLGCATKEKYDEQVRGWVGQTEEKLLLHWGPPLRVSQINDTKKIYHFRERQHFVNSSHNRYGGNTTVSTLECTTNFVVENGKVTDYSFSGNNCVAF